MSAETIQFPVTSTLPPIGQAVEWTGNMAWPSSRGYVLSHHAGNNFTRPYALVLLKDGGHHNVQDTRFQKESDRSQGFRLLNAGSITEQEAAKLLEALNAALLAKKEAEQRAREARAAKIALGKQLAKELLPAGHEWVIVAELKVNKSDSQTDYYAQATSKTVVLASSGNKRDSFAEMRKGAKRFKPTAKTVWLEQREKYSMGKGYYLSASDNSCASGWEISKSYLSDDVYLSLASGHCLDTAMYKVKA